MSSAVKMSTLEKEMNRGRGGNLARSPGPPTDYSKIRNPEFLRSSVDYYGLNTMTHSFLSVVTIQASQGS